MPTEYRLDAYDTAGVLQAQITDFLSLAYAKRVNAPGILTFELNGAHSLLSSLADKWQFEVMRRMPGQAWVQDFSSIFRDPEWSYVNTQRFKANCQGLMSMLGWRIVNWYADTINRSYWLGAKGESILKMLADYNAGPNATTGNGRIRNGAITGLAIEADGAHGNTLDWYCAYDNLLDTLQKLAFIAGGDFDLVKTSATVYTFTWYTGQRGTDRTATVKFSMELGNMAEPAFITPRSQEKTVATVGGPGEGSVRMVVNRTGVNYAAGNDVEMFVNATDASTSAGLNAAGDQALAEAQARDAFDFKVLQTPASRYGIEYFLGDLVTAINPFNGASYTQKIMGVDVALGDDGKENISVVMKTL